MRRLAGTTPPFSHDPPRAYPGASGLPPLLSWLMDTSRDWGHELLHSLIWLSWVFPLTFVVSALIIALLLRSTAWGRQVWTVSGGYFRGPGAWKVYAMLGLLLFFS